MKCCVFFDYSWEKKNILGDKLCFLASKLGALDSTLKALPLRPDTRCFHVSRFEDQVGSFQFRVTVNLHSTGTERVNAKTRQQLANRPWTFPSPATTCFRNTQDFSGQLLADSFSTEKLYCLSRRGNKRGKHVQQRRGRKAEFPQPSLDPRMWFASENLTDSRTLVQTGPILMSETELHLR